MGNDPKISVKFTTTQGVETKMSFNYGTTVGKILKLYLREIGHPELINNLQGKLCFLFQAKVLKFNDSTKVEDLFKKVDSPNILVNNVQGVI